jgi:hypothetical protein
MNSSIFELLVFEEKVVPIPQTVEVFVSGLGQVTIEV